MAASPDFEENLLTNIDDKVLQCAICMERFKSPKILPCQHTFCEICLTKWVKTSNGQLICPTCKRKWTLPSGGVPAITNNRFMNDLMQLISDISQQDRSKAKCDGCQKQATHWCGDCGGHFYCSVCINSHRTITILKAHKLLTIEDYYEKMSTQQFGMIQPRFCDNHTDAKLEFYCDTCQLPTCHKCTVVDHPTNDHKIMSLESALKKYLPSMKAKTQKISTKIRDLKHRKQTVIATRKELVQNKEGAELQIKKLSEQAIAEIKKQEIKLLCDVANMYKPMCKQIDSKIELLEHKIASAESIHSYLNHLLNFGGSVDIMTAQKQQLYHEDLTNVQCGDIDSELVFMENPECLEIDLGIIKGNNSIQTDAVASALSAEEKALKIKFKEGGPKVKLTVKPRSPELEAAILKTRGYDESNPYRTNEEKHGKNRIGEVNETETQNISTGNDQAGLKDSTMQPVIGAPTQPLGDLRYAPTMASLQQNSPMNVSSYTTMGQSANQPMNAVASDHVMASQSANQLMNASGAAQMIPSQSANQPMNAPSYKMVDMNTYALFPQSLPQSEGDLFGIRHIWNQSDKQNSQALISHSNQQMTGETVSKGDKGPPGFRKKMEIGMHAPGGALRQTLPEHSGPSEQQCSGKPGMIGDSEQTSDPHGKMEMIGHSKETYERTEVTSCSNKQNEDGTVQNQPVHHLQFPRQLQPISQIPQPPLLIPPQYYNDVLQTPNQTRPLLQHGAPPADHMQIFMQTLTIEEQQLLMQAAITTDISEGSTFQAPSSANTPSDDEDEKTVNDTIEVTGLDKTKNNLEVLQLYFESKRSGGGPVTNIEELDKGEKMQITFESAEVVPRVLERSHKCQGLQLTVTLALKRKKKRKLPRDTKAILLKGLSDDTNRETIDLYMESRTGIEEAPLMFFGDKPGVVLLKYSKDIPDFESVVHKVAKKKLNKGKISAEPVYLTDSILALNVPPNVTEDVVTMYFENSARSGGGDVDSVRFNTKKRLAVVSFRDYRVVDRVLERDHCLNNLRLDVQPYHECLGCESIDSCDEDSDTSQSLSSGRYTSQSMEGELSRQQNPSSEDAARMIQRVKKEKKKRKPSELPRDKTSMILKGLADDTSAETILLYMERCTHIEEDPELIFGEEPGTVMVRYDEDVGDFEKITHRISKKKLNQATVTVQPAYHTDCVLVEDLPPNVSEDSLTLYFESVKRSGGGEVDDVDLDEERNSAKVFFKDYRVVENVLHETHEINQRQVTVQPFYASLGYVVSSGELTPRIPKPVIVDVDPLIMEFIMAKQNQYTEEFKETLHDAHTDIEWPHQEQSDKVLLKPTLTSDTKDLHKIVKGWSKNAKSTFSQYLQGFKMATIMVLEGIWLRVKSEVGSLVNARDPVDLQMDQTSSTIQITGIAADVTRLKTRIEELIKDIEDEIQKAKQRITENVDIKDPFQIQQLQMFRFSKATSERLPGLQIKVASKSQRVTFEGLPNDITEAKVYMYQTLNGLPVRKFRPASRNVTEFLEDRDVAKKIYEIFKASKFRATYMVSEEIVTCSASNEDEMEQAVEILQNNIAEHFIDIKPQSQPALQKEEWKELVGRLEEEEKVFILPPVSGQRNAVTVVGFKPSLTQVVIKLTDFIKLHTVVEDVIQMELGRVRFLFDLKKSELQMVRQQAKQQPFRIDRYQNSTGILVKGTEDDVRAASEQLKKLAEKVSARPHPIDKPGMPALFREDKGQMYLRVVENEFNCRIDVTDPSEVETAMEVEAEEDVPMMPPPTTLTVLCYVTTKDGRRIVVGKGDLTQMPVDAIVNGSNQFLDHSGGLAKAIIDAGGQSIADETTRILRAKEGKLFPGQVVSTGSGDLPCKRIIHAVGPTWNRSSRKSYSEEKSYEEKMLHDTVCNSLSEAEKYQCRSVALPAISSGGFGFPLDLSVNTIIDAVDKFFSGTPPGCLMEVNLVDNADRTCKSFQDSVVKYYGNENVIIPSQFSGSVGNTNLSRERGRTKATQGGSRDTSLEPLSNPTELKTSEGVVIKLVKGSIAKQKTDIIVNTTQTSLSLNTGGVSAAILKVAGPALQQEVNAYKNAGWPVKEGVMIITNGARLKCKKVYHVLCCHWDGSPNAERILRDLMRKCFEKASQAGMFSIAFPAIGTGGLGFPSDFTAKVMYEEARKFSTSSPNSSLKEIRFVIYEKDHQTHQAFKDVIHQLTKKRHGGKVSPKKKSEDFQQQPPYQHGGSASYAGNTQFEEPIYGSHSSASGIEGKDSPYKNLKQTTKRSQMMIGNIIVQVEAGDITKERTDAIVNSTNESLDLSMGGVSKAIVAAGGQGIVKECKSLGRQQADTVVMTDAGNLQCNNIIHMITPYQKLDDSITRMLLFAEQKQVKSLAMPAIGTGALAQDAATVAEQTLTAIDDFYQQGNTQCLKLIRIVLFQRPMVQTFQQAMVSLLGKPAKDKRGLMRKALDKFGEFTSKWTSWKGASPGDIVKKWNTLLLYIFADEKKDIDGAIKKLETFIGSEFVDMTVSKENVGKITDEELYQINVTAERLQVKVDKISTGSVTHLRLQGRVQSVFQVQEEISKILDRIAEEERRKNEARLLAKNVKWMYLNQGEQFEEYDDEIIGIIEQARVEGKKDVEFEIEGGKYRINFMTEEEIDLDDMSKVPVKRELREAGVPLPSNWVDMTQHGNFRKETLDPKTTEYQGVEQAFKQTLQRGYILNKIVRIERLQNIQQYRQYVILKQTLDTKNPKGTKNERTLYHGTSADSVDKISKKGFNRSFAGKNATLYGAGTYFAVNSEMSARSIYSPPDANGYKYIYQAKVLTGEFAVGSQNMLVPPSKNPNDPTDCYDSVVDNMQNPEIFVVFNDAVAYPEYLIVFY